MSRCFSFLLLLFAVHLSAQPHVRYVPAPDDVHPDAAQNKIAARKYYELSCSDTSNHWSYNDTTYEIYNRNGQLVSTVRKESGSGEVINEDHFHYDREGRIICDTEFLPKDSLKITTYEYTHNKTTIHNPPSEYADILPTVYRNYDDHANLISEYRVNGAGDTVNLMQSNGGLQVSTWRMRQSNGKFKTEDSVIYADAPGFSMEKVVIFRDDETVRSSTVYYYNPSGNPDICVEVRNGIVTDCTYYYYTLTRLSHEVTVIFTDWGKFERHDIYSYNDRGLLVQKREWTDEPDTYIIDEYRYNESGLLSEHNVFYEYVDGRPNYHVRCERWEYTYY